MIIESVAVVLVGCSRRSAGLLHTFDGDGACVVAGLLRAARNAERVDPADAFAYAARDVADTLACPALYERGVHR